MKYTYSIQSLTEISKLTQDEILKTYQQHGIEEIAEIHELVKGFAFSDLLDMEEFKECEDLEELQKQARKVYDLFEVCYIEYLKTYLPKTSEDMLRQIWKDVSADSCCETFPFIVEQMEKYLHYFNYFKEKGLLRE